IVAETNVIPEEARNGAELTAIRTTSPGFHGNDVDFVVVNTDAFQQFLGSGRNESHKVEQRKIDLVPSHRGVVLESRFDIFSVDLGRLIHRLQLAASRIVHYERPGIVGFSPDDGA